MASISYLATICILISHSLFYCTSAAVHHSHNIDNNNIERESDGSYRSRDFDHYNDAGHNSEFDHEAILGSVKEAEEFDKLSPEESKQRLQVLLYKMDLNGDKNIDRDELKKWILNSFRKISREETQERLSEADENRDGSVSWQEYLQDAFGADSEDEVSSGDTGDTGMYLHEEKAMWLAADVDGDGKLDITEFEVFTNPEEHEVMHPYILNQTLREKDSNKDGFIDFDEYLSDRGVQRDQEWMLSERDKFDQELDSNRDGILDGSEIRHWVIPDNDEIAEEEVDHLFASADDNRDSVLTYEEVLDHYDVFVGSEATDYGTDLRFDDEL